MCVSATILMYQIIVANKGQNHLSEIIPYPTVIHSSRILSQSRSTLMDVVNGHNQQQIRVINHDSCMVFIPEFDGGQNFIGSLNRWQPYFTVFLNLTM